MSTLEHIQKLPQTQNNVEIPEFAVQSKTTTASPPPPPSGNLKTQLSRATRFGHNLTQMPAMQAKAAPATQSPSPSNAMAGMDAHSFYGMMNHQVESILPQLQAKMMQQPMSGEVMQQAGAPPGGAAGGGGGGGKKGGGGDMKGKMGGAMGKAGDMMGKMGGPMGKVGGAVGKAGGKVGGKGGGK
jgi:hypothetical protein